MEHKINGLHHITVLAGNPQRNYDFYTKVMGMRLVKKTVNFDAPGVYHFYFADEIGSPGTVLTFFPFPDALPGERGIGEAAMVSFSLPKGSMDFWMERLSRFDISFRGPQQKFGYNYITFADHDGVAIRLVEDDVAHLLGWEIPGLPRRHSVRKFFGVTVCLTRSNSTEKLLTEILGFRLEAEDENLKRYLSGEGDRKARFDIKVNPSKSRAIQSAGSVHHIAWRTSSDESQLEWLRKLRENGYRPTEVIDRQYFHSVYFREPGGVLFEIATDEPGFMTDEERQSLGEALKLPKMYESRREHIEKTLIPIRQGNTVNY